MAPNVLQVLVSNAARRRHNARIATTSAVIFDLNGTLTDPAVEGLRAALHPAVAAILGVDPDAYAAALTRSYPQRALGAFGDTRATLAVIAAQLGASPSGAALERARAERLAQFRHLLEPRSDAVATLSALADRGLELGLISDCTSETAELWPELPYAAYIAQPVFSCLVGMRKPEPAIYREACRRLAVEPAACLFVGDGGSRELSGAVAVGMRAVLLANDHVSAGSDWRYDPDAEYAGAAVSQLGDVLALVGPTG